MSLNERWTAADIPILTGKVVIITGANSGIGLEAARELSRREAEVILACRDEGRAEEAQREIWREIPDAKLVFLKLDLGDLNSIRSFADRFKEEYQQLDVLLNNAGIMLVPYGITADGFEMTLGINHLGHFALTGLLTDRLQATPDARVVTISSNAHYGGQLDFSNLMYQQGGYSPMKAYSRSKLANLLFTYELQRRFEYHGVNAKALAAHPGIAATGLADHLLQGRFRRLIRGAMKLAFQSAARGALPGLRAAVDPRAQAGAYYGPNGRGERGGFPVVVSSSQASHDPEAGARLWEISAELTGVHYLD